MFVVFILLGDSRNEKIKRTCAVLHKKSTITTAAIKAEHATRKIAVNMKSIAVATTKSRKLNKNVTEFDDTTPQKGNNAG